MNSSAIVLHEPPRGRPFGGGGGHRNGGLGADSPHQLVYRHPGYPHRTAKSQKTYTQHQLLVLVLFRDFRNQHYREFMDDGGDRETVQEVLGLSVIPHFTTLQKFLCRIKSLYLRLTFRKTVNLFYSADDVIPITALDSSGFTSGYCSHYFSERTGKLRKHFLKTSIPVDTELQVITGFIVSKSRVHDTRHARKLLRQCHRFRTSD